MIPRPYFLKNKEWYRRKGFLEGYELTEKAPLEAIKSYEMCQRFFDGNKSDAEAEDTDEKRTCK